MEIQLAKQHGFCFGVKRAIQIAEAYKNSFTFGPLIHNNLEIQRLKNQFNVGLKENIEEFKSGDKLIIRTHGIEKENLDYLHQNNIKFIDATCPFVTKLQKTVKEMSRQNYDIVIFGDINHPEVQGVKSYATNPYVVLSTKELDNIVFNHKPLVKTNYYSLYKPTNNIMKDLIMLTTNHYQTQEDTDDSQSINTLLLL